MGLFGPFLYHICNKYVFYITCTGIEFWWIVHYQLFYKLEQIRIFLKFHFLEGNLSTSFINSFGIYLPSCCDMTTSKCLTVILYFGVHLCNWTTQHHVINMCGKSNKNFSANPFQTWHQEWNQWGLYNKPHYWSSSDVDWFMYLIRG